MFSMLMQDATDMIRLLATPVIRTLLGSLHTPWSVLAVSRSVVLPYLIATALWNGTTGAFSRNRLRGGNSAGCINSPAARPRRWASHAAMATTEIQRCRTGLPMTSSSPRSGSQRMICKRATNAATSLLMGLGNSFSVSGLAPAGA